MTIKIGFSGTGGVGKTTLATMVAQTMGLTLPPSAARTVLREWGITEADQNAMTPAQLWELQQAIWAERARQETYYEAEGIGTIWDRTLLDHLGYAMLRAGASITPPVMEDLKEKVLRNLESYSAFVFFMKPDWLPPVDRMRDPAEGFRCLHNYALYGFLGIHVDPKKVIFLSPTQYGSEKLYFEFLMGQFRKRELFF